MRVLLTIFIFIFIVFSGYAQDHKDTLSVFPGVERFQRSKQSPNHKPADTLKQGIDTLTKKPEKSEKRKDSTSTDTIAVGQSKIILKNDSQTKNGASDKITKIRELLSFKKIFWSVLLLILTYFILKVIVLIINRLSERSTSNRIALKSFVPFIRIVGWTIVLFIIIYGIFQPSFETFFIILASLGVAVGLAAQDILKNLFGGIMIIFNHPFQLGDKVQIGEHYGEVKDIGLYACSILTKNDSLVSVPNAEIIKNSVSNANNGMSYCQVVAEIYLPIDIDTNIARQIATEAAQVSRFIYLNKPIKILFDNVIKERRAFLKMSIKAYVLDIRYEFDFKSDMTEIVIEEFLKQKLIDKKDLM